MSNSAQLHSMTHGREGRKGQYFGTPKRAVMDLPRHVGVEGASWHTHSCPPVHANTALKFGE